NEEIQSFCKLTYDVSFPILGKIDVNGEKESPVYSYLKQQAPGLLGTEAIKWNFTKFLISKEGKVVKRYAPQVAPKNMENDIESEL
ncbi:MAG: glutathione peroxidase, partial [Bdellovibrionales bacterium]|nr:glutathione peroxidase [Bdellovibrionales bacterium]